MHGMDRSYYCSFHGQAAYRRLKASWLNITLGVECDNELEYDETS